MPHLLLIVTYHTKPGVREEFLSEVRTSGLLDQIRAEDGCIRYDYYLDVQNPDRILLVEEWETEEKQQKHRQTTNMAQLTAIKENYVVETILERH